MFLLVLHMHYLNKHSNDHILFTMGLLVLHLHCVNKQSKDHILFTLCLLVLHLYYVNKVIIIYCLPWVYWTYTCILIKVSCNLKLFGSHPTNYMIMANNETIMAPNAMTMSKMELIDRIMITISI